METTRRILLVAPAVLLLAGCNSTGPNASQRISLSARTGSAGAPAATGAALADVVVTGSGGAGEKNPAPKGVSPVQAGARPGCTAGPGQGGPRPHRKPEPEAQETE